MKFENMHVLLTGACGGIGQEIARQLAQKGASLHLTDRDESTLNSLQQELSSSAKAGQRITTSVIDLLNDAEIQQWIEALNQQHPINVLINNAGVAGFGLFEDQRAQDIELVMQLNCLVPIKLSRMLLPMMRQQAEARIINVASIFGAIGFPGYSLYSASKYSIRGFSQALSRELSDSSISVGCFMPRATRTAINSSSVVELNRKMNVTMDSPQKVATELTRFIASKDQELALGWPEKLLVKINSLFPMLIGNAICKKLPLIKQYAAA